MLKVSGLCINPLISNLTTLITISLVCNQQGKNAERWCICKALIETQQCVATELICCVNDKMGSKCSFIWGNPWRQAVAGGIMIQIIPGKVHHALNFSTKSKWGVKNKFNFTAPLSSERKQPCDYRRLLIPRQSGPFWSPGYLCS